MESSIKFILILSFFPAFIWAQDGKNTAFSFTDVPSNARLGALGGVNVSLADQDLNLFFSNPALLGIQNSNHVSVSHIPYYGDIRLNSVAYAHSMGDSSIWAGGVHYLNYGQMERYDETGMAQGEFSAREYLVALGYSHQVDQFRIGINLKYAGSVIDNYQATALLFDLGAVFKHPDQDIVIGLVIRNAGFMLSEYTEIGGSSLPFDVQVGGSIKPAHMPVRFSLTARHLSRRNLLVPEETGFGNNGDPGIVDKIMGRMVLGAEFLIHKNFNLRAGYNHLISHELSLENASGGAGFSFGLMFKVKAFEFAYSRAFYHVSGGINYFTLSSNLNSFFRKKS
ncbi:MAG: type IX secretion system protein PorQ [Candidatus Cyclobacteriaceae bacterium M3_2C_046]